MQADFDKVLVFDTTSPDGFKYVDLDTLFLLRHYQNGVDSEVHIFSQNWNYTLIGQDLGVLKYHFQPTNYYELRIKSQTKKYVIKDITVRTLPASRKCQEEGSTIERITLNDTMIFKLPYIIRK